MTIFHGRCGRCKKFKGNGKKCSEDSKKRGKIYANDIQCDNAEE